jgi:hypothetical protein
MAMWFAFLLDRRQNNVNDVETDRETGTRQMFPPFLSPFLARAARNVYDPAVKLD